MQKIIDSLKSNKTMSENSSNCRWLNAHEDRSAGIRTFSGRCVALSDVSGTGDYNLVIAEPRFNQPGCVGTDNATETSLITGRLRIFRGAATLCSDRPLQGPPSTLLSFYTDELEARVPALAVSVGPYVFLYKNSKPFYKFTLPVLPTTALESDIWRRVVENYNAEFINEMLGALRALPFKELSSRSQKLLSLASSTWTSSSTGPEKHQVLDTFIRKYLQSDSPQKLSIINCMALLAKNSLNQGSVSCLVVATEAGHVYFLDPQGYNILHQASISSDLNAAGPAFMDCSGMFDVEFRCIVCLRDGTVHILRRGWLEGRKLFQVPSGDCVVEMLVIQPEQFVILGLKNGSIVCYSKRGKKLWHISTGPSTAVTCLALVPLPHLNTCLIAVGLCPTDPTQNRSGVLHLYQNRNLVDTIFLVDIPAVVKFGRLGQEENILVIITRDGSLLFRILKRIADFLTVSSQIDLNANAGPLSRALPLPKRSKLFAEQALRERQNAQTMHQTFQQDLIRLRLTAGRAMMKTLHFVDQNISDSVKNPIKISAQVLGLGPRFTLTLTLENLSQDTSMQDLKVVLHAQISKYRIDNCYISVPLLPPELQFKVETNIQELFDNEPTENIENYDSTAIVPIRVFVLVPGQVQPVLATTINMPPTDPLAFMV